MNVNGLEPRDVQYLVIPDPLYKNWSKIEQKRGSAEIGVALLLHSECRLEAFDIAKNFQRQGFGTNLFKVVEDVLEQKGCTQVCLNAIRSAAPFYEKQGAYRTYEELPFEHNWNGLRSYCKQIVSRGNS